MEDDLLAARVLVVVVTRACDLASVQEGWYRIPVLRAPRALHAEYLAFYPTAGCGAARWAVRWYAAIRAVTLATRAELLPAEAGHPRASQRYYRFALGEICELPAPLPSRRLRRVSFIPTSMRQLLAARDLTELWQPAAPTPGAGWGSLWGAGVNG